MKKNFVKPGALAVAVTLAFVFAACAQPTDESAGAGSPTIIRLYLDRQDRPNITSGSDQLEFTVGTLDLDYQGSGYLMNTSGAHRFVNGKVKAHDTNYYGDMDPVDTLYLQSKETPLYAIYNTTGSVVGNVAVDVEDGKGYYVDIELINMTYDSIDQGKVYSGSDSFYIACTVTSGGPGTPNGATGGTYYYTPDHTSLHSDPQTSSYDRIDTVDLSPGINELHFKYFTLVP